MAIRVKCDQCGRGFEVSDQFAGQRMKCGCGHTIHVGDDAEVMDFLCEELDIKNDPLSAETVTDWAKATGAPPEIARRIEKRLSPKKSSNAAFMMAITGGVLTLLLLVALVAFLFGR